MTRPTRTILTPALAQEIAADTSRIIGMNVLITDHTATVIGSGDQTRVATLHEASIEVLRTRQPISHTAAQARALRGVKPGITLPILLDGHAVGTVGITGSPARVTPFGRVVQRQTEILLTEADLLQDRLHRQQALENLVRDIAYLDPDTGGSAPLATRAAELGVDLTVPRAAIVIDTTEGGGGADSGPPHELPPPASALALTPSPRRTVRETFPAAQDIIAEMIAGRFAVLHRTAEDAAPEPVRERCQQLAVTLRERHGLTARIGIGQPAADLDALHESYQDASTAVRVGSHATRSATATDVFPITELRLQQLLAAVAQGPRDRFVALHLTGLLTQPDWPDLCQTMIAWSETGFNLVHAATRLRIHRNTLLYRLEKITRLCGHPVRQPRHGTAMYLACLAHHTDNTRGAASGPAPDVKHSSTAPESTSWE